MKLRNFNNVIRPISVNHAGLRRINPTTIQMEREEARKSKALIVDDEVDICYLLKGILRYKNIDADYVTSLSEAQEFVKSQSPALIFLDNHLSDGIGIDNIRKFKEHNPSSVIVMITAHDTPADRQKAYSEGVDYFIGKPFTRDIILRTIEKIS